MEVFSRLVGHETQKNVLSLMFEAGTLPHALMLVGPRGVGKSTLVEAILAHLVEGNTHANPDIVRVGVLRDEKTEKKKSAISVEQIREARDRFSLSALGGKKLLIIEDAQLLNAAAANALLKTLEEPRGDAHVILISESAEALPATIRSRCQVLALSLVPSGLIASALERRGLSKKEAEELAGAALGRPGRAIRLIEDSAYRAETETAAAQLSVLRDASIAERLRRAGELLPKGESDKKAALELLFDTWEPALRDHLLGNGGSTKPIETLLAARRDVRRNANPQLQLERVLLSL